MGRLIFTERGDSRWGTLEEPKRQNILPYVVGCVSVVIASMGPGLYQGVQKTKQEWQERKGESTLPRGRVLSEEVTLNGQMKVRILLSNGEPVAFACPVRKGAPITCKQE